MTTFLMEQWEGNPVLMTGYSMLVATRLEQSGATDTWWIREYRSSGSVPSLDVEVAIPIDARPDKLLLGELRRRVPSCLFNDDRARP